MTNSLVEMLSQPQWQRIALTLVHFLWQGLAIAVGLAAILCLFQVRESRTRYGLSLAALVLMTVCPVVTFFVVEPVSESFVADSSESLLAIESGRERLMTVPTAIVTSAASESDSFRVLPSVQPYLLAARKALPRSAASSMKSPTYREQHCASRCCARAARSIMRQLPRLLPGCTTPRAT